MMDTIRAAAREVADALRETWGVPPTLVPVNREEKKEGDGLMAWLRVQAGCRVKPEEQRAVEAFRGLQQIRVVDAATRVSDAIPTRLVRIFFERLDAQPVHRVCTVEREPTLSTRKIPIVDDTGNQAQLVGSGVGMTSLDPAMSSLTLGCYTLCSRPVIVHNSVLRDAGIDLLPILTEVLADRIGRAVTHYATNGSGIGEPLGLLADNGGVPTLVTTASSTAITFDDLLSLYHAVSEEGRKTGAWMMSPSTHAHLRKLVDERGRPLLIINPASEQPATIFGRPVVENPAMPEIAPGKKTIIFGDFSRFIIRERNSLRIEVLKERFAYQDSTAVMLFHDFDCGLAATPNTKAIGCLKMKN